MEDRSWMGLRRHAMVAAQLRTHRVRPKFFASHHTTKLLDSSIMLSHYLHFEFSSGRPPKSCDMYKLNVCVAQHLKFLKALTSLNT